jgi:hypothetical protein
MRAARWVHQAILGPEKWPNKDLALRGMMILEPFLDRFRKVWNGGGTVYYRWHPDD